VVSCSLLPSCIQQQQQQKSSLRLIFVYYADFLFFIFFRKNDEVDFFRCVYLSCLDQFFLFDLENMMISESHFFFLLCDFPNVTLCWKKMKLTNLKTK
jgi:hypothetical protein